MGAITVDDYTYKSDHVLFPEEIDNRIEQLDRTIREAWEGDGPFIEDTEEYEALRAFREEVERVTGRTFDTATLVPQDEFEDYARDYAEEVAADAEFLWQFVDWERFAVSLKQDYTVLDFGVDQVYVKN